MTKAERLMFSQILTKEIINLVDQGYLHPPDLYDMAVREAFVIDLQGKPVEALRAAYGAFRNGMYRGDDLDRKIMIELNREAPRDV